MSDASVASALRSHARLVVVEAPAGCGKTFQGADYAQEVARKIGNGRVLILTHTHAACDVFASRTRTCGRNVDIRTIDSLVGQVGAAYHKSLGLPSDIAVWARNQEDGYAKLASKVAALLRASPMVAQSLARRYPIIICDEHQDASADQHVVVMACYEAGASIRVFGDPMQRIYRSRKKTVMVADNTRWDDLKLKADVFDHLNEPHRWKSSSTSLGGWIFNARVALSTGGQIALGGTLPGGISVIIAENQESRLRGVYRLVKEARKPIDATVKTAKSLLVLSSQNATVEALRAFFYRQLPIWEGHVRARVAVLAEDLQEHKGDPTSITLAVVKFLNGVATGFSPSAYGDILLEEVSSGCVAKRSGKPAALQVLGRIILDQPDHKGAANMLLRLNDFRMNLPAFEAVKIDYQREFWDAVRLGQFDDPVEGLSEILRRHSYARPSPPAKAISTVHKAKGLECDDVVIMPCDAQHFRDTEAARCLLYVAMSRAKRSLTFVISQHDPSPLVMF